MIVGVGQTLSNARRAATLSRRCHYFLASIGLLGARLEVLDGLGGLGRVGLGGGLVVLGYGAVTRARCGGSAFSGSSLWRFRRIGRSHASGSHISRDHGCERL